MDPTVFVQLAEAQREHATALIRACTAALRRGRCALAESEDDAVDQPLAVVSWRGADHASALVEVGLPAEHAARWLSRSIAFQDVDPLPERWRAVGITIATLVGDLEERAEVEKAEAAEAAPEVPKPPPPAAKPAPAPPAPEPVAQPITPPVAPVPTLLPVAAVAAGPLVGPESALRLGGWARGSFWALPALELTTSCRYVRRPSEESEADVRLSWLGASAGLGSRVTLDRLDLSAQVRVEIAVERVGASHAAGSDAIWLGGGRGGVELRWPSRAGFSGVFGAEATRFGRGIRVRVEGEQVVELPASTYTMVGGMAFGW